MATTRPLAIEGKKSGYVGFFHFLAVEDRVLGKKAESPLALSHIRCLPPLTLAGQASSSTHWFQIEILEEIVLIETHPNKKAILGAYPSTYEQSEPKE